ncbi:unnamed protein product, partial [Amoebophrya sp. A120]|eukprot:GSA120T00008530001.1
MDFIFCSAQLCFARRDCFQQIFDVDVVVAMNMKTRQTV